MTIACDYQMKHSLYIGDAATTLRTFQDSSVQLVVTSPPYWNLKDYGVADQIGFNDTYDTYLARLFEVWQECARVLSPGCRIAINIGDQFLRGSQSPTGSYQVVPIHADIINQLRRLGLDCMGNIIWRKITTTKTTGGGTWMGSTYHPRDGHVTYEHEYIILFRKPGQTKAQSREAYEGSRMTKEQRSEWFRGMWSFPPARQGKGHDAMFPLELPSRLIQMYTYKGEMVLDPFVGSGTTIEAADRLGRVGVGIDINPTSMALCQGRLQSQILLNASSC